MKSHLKGWKTYWYVEEHVRVLDYPFETAGVVWEVITVISRGCIPQENTFDLTRVLFCHFRISAHDIAVAGICHQNELPLRISLEDPFQQVFSDLQSGADVAEIQRSGIEGTSRIGLVDEIHVVARHLFLLINSMLASLLFIKD